VVLSNKSCPRNAFDWSVYKKEPRWLSPSLEREFAIGVLRPILDYAFSDSGVRLDIRAEAVNLYYDGGSLLKLHGRKRGPHKAVFDLGYVGGKGPKVEWVASTDDAQTLVDRLGERRHQMDAHREAGHARAEVRNEQFIARANDGRSTGSVGDFLVVDLEYSYARRRFDLVLIETVELPRPRLILAELKCNYGALLNEAGLPAHAEDFCDLLGAEGGRHVDIVKDELAHLFRQKRRLGLLSDALALECFSPEPPLFLVVFADYDARQRQATTALSRMHAVMRERLGDLRLLRFADLRDVSDRGTGAGLRLGRDEVMASGAFDAYRSGRG